MVTTGPTGPTAIARKVVSTGAQNPAVDPAAKEQEKAKLHRRYDPFLQKWGVPRAHADRFVELKMAIAEAQEDLQGAVRQARAQGGTADVEAMRGKLVTAMWDEIRQILGKEGYPRLWRL